MGNAVSARIGLMILALSGIVFLPLPTVRADSTSALINAQLDRPIDIDLDYALPEAIRKIEDKTSVPIKVDASVWDLLPWGEDTTVTAKFRNVSLRQALGNLTRKEGLVFTLGNEAVQIAPMPGLTRLGRRATVQELAALDTLASNTLPALTGVSTVRSVLAAVDVKLEATPPFAIEDRLSNDQRDKPFDVPRDATLMDALDLMSRDTPATWYPWGKYLVVVPKQTLVRDQLSRTLTVRYNNTEISQVLEDLRKAAGIEFVITPGAIQQVPSEFRTIRVYWENVSVEQALESLKGLTGLQYQVTDYGVSISNALQGLAPDAASAANAADPVVAMMPLENGLQVLVRRSELPTDVQAYIKHRSEAEIAHLREMMLKEGFKPGAATTQATSQPAN